MQQALGERHEQRPCNGDNQERSLLQDLHGLRVLLVDDQEDALESLAALLERRGAQVVTSLGPRAALEFLQTGSIDIIASDIAMPLLNGLEFLKAARGIERASAIPAIAISALHAFPFEVRAQAAGFAELVSKPVDIERLARLIRSLVPSASQN